ncbi:MgtC/SapB family protein [Motiliproteus sp. SC1-56]|uniref:MgtC/SapB family protein n=1 Tax=Motiliproteus sp. SC1-56 TaxID=2799565 RepID=UPI001A8D9498|nr:MgtC/SapB family protein [Motiliproteus sp. SC1-56]
MEWQNELATLLSLDFLLDIRPLAWGGVICAMISASVIGIERQLLGKPVGVRTSTLICLGTYVFIAISNHVMRDITDPSRIIGQAITGVGFLGAGVMMTRDGAITGVTSAACIWMLAAIGVVIGVGESLLGVKLAILSVIVLVGVDMAEESFKWMQRGVHHRLGRRRFGRRKLDAQAGSE